ncbi:hypothetical protein MMC07_004219 [Pseudocyphellaria aurata]|nr:hypothetical protein [Pseudocyphellaria aurata]
MSSLGFPLFMLFSIAFAQLLSTGLLGEANVPDIESFPESDPSLFLNSPIKNSITSDVDTQSFNFDNIVPVNLNLVASIPSVSTDQFPSDISSLDPQQPSIGVETTAIVAGVPTDLGKSQTSCDSDSTNPGAKLRREEGESCLVPFKPSLPDLNEFIHWILQFINGDAQRNAPKGALTEKKKKDIYDEDMAKYRPSLDYKNPVWQSPQLNPCGMGNAWRTWSLCCLGPPRRRAVPPVAPVRPQKRAVTPVIDMENCQLFDKKRPFCIVPGPAYQFCCHRLDPDQFNGYGYLGEDCWPMWGGWGPDGLRLRVDN